MTEPPRFLLDLLIRRHARAVEDGVWSVLPADAPVQHYDRRAKAYDAIVGSTLYNRLLWGSSPRAYSAFAERAVQSDSGPLLDAGCGSLVFTADAYARTRRPIVLLDQSLGMLHAARDRMRRAAGTVPDSVVLLQGDLRDLPFHAGSFATALCMGMLHLFDDVTSLVGGVAGAVRPGGGLFFTSLVAETWLGSGYLSLLHRAGEVAAPRNLGRLSIELREGAPRGHQLDIEVEGNVAFIAGRAGADPAAGV